MKTLMKNKLIGIWQAVTAVLLFVFLTGVANAGIAEGLATGKPLQDVIQTSFDAGVELKDLVTQLDAAGVAGDEIICVLFQAGQDNAAVIAAALDAGLGSSDVAVWAQLCGATQSEIQMGYSMAGDSLPGITIFSNHATTLEGSAKEYLYNPPSPSQ